MHPSLTDEIVVRVIYAARKYLLKELENWCISFIVEEVDMYAFIRILNELASHNRAFQDVISTIGTF